MATLLFVGNIFYDLIIVFSANLPNKCNGRIYSNLKEDFAGAHDATRLNHIINSNRSLKANIKILETLSKPRRQRQRRRGKTKGLLSGTMALRVHYKTLYISQP